jgi:hypothetical protein
MVFSTQHENEPKERGGKVSYTRLLGLFNLDLDKFYKLFVLNLPGYSLIVLILCLGLFSLFYLTLHPNCEVLSKSPFPISTKVLILPLSLSSAILSGFAVYLILKESIGKKLSRENLVEQVWRCTAFFQIVSFIILLFIV